MKTFVFFVLQVFISSLIFGQFFKPPIDTSVFNKWSFIESGAISSDGSYISYSVKNGNTGNSNLTIKSLKRPWEFKISDAADVKFTSNERFAVFFKQDTLHLLQLDSGKIESISPVESYFIWGQNGNEYLIYLLNNNKHSLVVRSLQNNSEEEFLRVKSYLPYKDERTIFFTQESIESDQATLCLKKININDMGVTKIWSTPDSNAEIKLSSVAFDTNNKQIAFLVNKNGKIALWLYKEQDKKLILFAEKSIPIFVNNMEIKDICDAGFSSNGKELFITLQRKEALAKKSSSVSVDIWSYKDKLLQAQQLYKMGNTIPFLYNQNYMAAVNVLHPSIIDLNEDYEDVTLLGGKADSFAFVARSGEGSSTERNWNPASRRSFFFVSTRTGNRRRIDYSFDRRSTGGKYLYGYDQLYQSLYVYNIFSGRSYNISNCFPVTCRLDEDYDEPGTRGTGIGVAGWSSNDSSIIMYDKYDIWKVNPAGLGHAINLTQGYGRKHHIVFRLIGGYSMKAPIEISSTYILSAFNEITKESGFFSFCIKRNELPKLLFMGPYVFEGPYRNSLDSDWLQDDTSTNCLVLRESSSESPNYFVTHNFKKFTSVSAVYPEANYNWLSSEVVKWVSNNIKLSGVLYKPTNFNPKRKYPVIINYYEKLSQHANEYTRPAYSSGNINIPWFVSRGYIVFTPDIYYKIGYPGQSAYNAIISGTKFISKYPWIDSKKIAIEGHSWGGFETNYIITHSNLYCAALSASSISDFISDYGSLTKYGNTKQFFYELEQSRIGATPWDRPDLYIENSPVLRANKVNTPLMMMNNKDDAIVPFSQGIEFFTALRRLRKKVWMLQYDGEGHNVLNNASIDYTVRMTQFFDHYCKGFPAPRWMKEGVPAVLKGVDSGLEIE